MLAGELGLPLDGARPAAGLNAPGLCRSTVADFLFMGHPDPRIKCRFHAASSLGDMIAWQRGHLTVVSLTAISETELSENARSIAQKSIAMNRKDFVPWQPAATWARNESAGMISLQLSHCLTNFRREHSLSMCSASVGTSMI